MTSLRTFQNEIDEIHARELAKQRTNGTMEKEKENKKPAAVKGKGKDDTADSLKSDPAASESGIQEIEDKILVCFSLYANLRLGVTLGFVADFAPIQTTQ